MGCWSRNNAEKTKYMNKSHHQNLGQNQSIRVANEGRGERCLQGFGWEPLREEVTGKT
jgi:hypothetical protein